MPCNKLNKQTHPFKIIDEVQNALDNLDVHCLSGLDGTVVNGNLKIGWSSIMHGSLGNNIPFDKSTGSNINYRSHHSCYNRTLGNNYNNLVGGGTDIYDADGDF